MKTIFAGFVIVCLTVPISFACGDAPAEALARVEALKDRLDHRRPGTPFCDWDSHFGLVFGKELGIGGIRAAWNRLPVDVSLRFARVRLLDATTGQVLAGDASTTVSLPYAAIQSGAPGVLSATVTTFFVATNAVYTRVHIANATDQPRTILLSIDGTIPESGLLESPREAYLTRSRALLLTGQFKAPYERDLSPVGIWAKIVPNFSLAGVEVSFGEKNEQLSEASRIYQVNGTLFYRLVSAPIVLLPGQKHETGFGTLLAINDSAFCINNEGLLLPAFQSPDGALKSARNRWALNFDRVPRPADLGESLLRTYDHALQVLYANRMAGSKAFSGLRDGLTPLCSKFEKSELTPSQAACVSAAWAEIDPETARNTVRQMVNHMGNEGNFLPLAPSPNQWRQLEPYIGSDHPLIAWSAWRIYQVTGDRHILEEIYPALQKNLGWWYETHFRPQTQIFAYLSVGEMGETAAGRTDIADPVAARGLYGVDLNGSILGEVRSLTRIAEEIGQPYESVRWGYRAEALAQAIAERLYSSENTRLFDLWADKREFLAEPWLRSFYGLWGHIQLPEEGNTRYIEASLLAPGEFGGVYPLSTVGRSGQFYKPDKVDEGAICPLDHALIVRAVQANGMKEDADALAQSILDMIAASGVFAYAYHGDTGERIDSQGINTSTTAANFILLALRRYRIEEGWAQ